MRKFALINLCALFVCASQVASAQRTQPTTARPAATPTRPAATPPLTQPATAPKVDDCGCEVETPPDVLAVVNGVRVMTKEIDDPIREKIQQLQQNVTDARKRELNLQINSMLLVAEAKKRGVASTRLIDEEIIKKTPEPTEAEARAFYDQNKARINAEWSADIQAQIAQYLRDQRQGERAKQLAEQLRAAAAVKMNVTEATPPATPADRARVFATVNGTPVTSAMIEDSLKPLVASTQQQVYTLRKTALDQRINDMLLEQEAKKRQTTERAVLDAEINAKLKPVTETDARAFYDQNKARINGDFAQTKAQIVQYLEGQQQENVSSAFAEQLRRGTAVQTFLHEPPLPVYQISTDDQPSRGAANAPVTVVEFTDFQCPSCAAMEPVIERIMTEYSASVRLVVRDFPLTQHENAFKAAEAAEAARAQGKYWEYTHLLFANQKALEVTKLKEYATQVGLDRQKFDALLDSGQLADKVQIDSVDGTRLGVSATPTLFVNGRPLQERSYEALKSAIDVALKEKGRG
ncbi:MAG: thioredoxin domain-containing protein [Pyrinomonadaceae bacterium]